ncbi:Regulator of chromosome condensation (RCC1) family with FYVE zinc finger domain [Hibiscus syriacus]|uniref:Regulator of chromosome condensation (RCC1) family with FYVE zinc finger domain n=1 Tax=Hibiscus syriacus TaxID=106335 RepID=A0A6A3C0G2_HIBSY|nr:Regulator of chromosome condensation (RCC1) family with FYVE zinc finger domain [Hibiscus syriacus]
MADLQRNGVVDRDINQAITTLKKGTYLLKYGRRGKPKFCPFKLSNDESKLIWYSRRKEKHIRLSHVSRIIPGQRTVSIVLFLNHHSFILISFNILCLGLQAVFQRYPQPEKEYQSFSLILNDRSLDLICKDKKEAEVWLFGLKALVSHGINRKWRVEAGSDTTVSGDSPELHNKKSPPNPHFPLSDLFFALCFALLQDRGDAQGIQAPSEPGNRLGKTFADIVTHAASIKVTSKPDLVEFGLIAASCVENINNRSSGADVVRASSSSSVSSLSHGSCKEDVDALVDIFIWGQGVGEGILGGGEDKVESSFNTKIDALLPKAMESTTVLDVHGIACGSSHAVIVTKQGEIFSWGEESGGRLGHGADADVPQPKLMDTLRGMNFQSAACGEYHTCAVTVSGDLYTWGDGAHSSGLLGHGSDVSHWIPRRVSDMDGMHVSYVSCGPWHTALLTSGGELFTFGDGYFGALGHGDRSSTTVLRKVETLSRLRTTRVSCGSWHTAAVVVTESSDDGCPDSSSSTKLFTWGDGDKGELGHGNREPRLSPQSVDALFDVNISQVACGQNLTVTLSTSGQVYTMGSSAYGQLGSRTVDGKVPTRVGGKIAGRFVEEIACGSHHVAVVTSKKEVYTWGKGTNGQLGHGNTDDRETPTRVDFLKDKQVKSVVCGSNFTAVLSLHKWVPSADQSMCSSCRNPFGFIRKRHNCYNCGLIFCKSCTTRKSLKASLAPIMNKPYRVCDDCFAKLKKSGEPFSAFLPPKAQNGNIPRKFDESIDKEVLALRSHAQLSRLSSLGSSSQAESRLSRSELKLDFENRTIFPAQTGNFHLGGFNTPRLPIYPVGDSRKSLPPISRRTSRATSPASGKSSNRSSTVTIDDSKQMNDNANQEIINLRAQVEALTCKSRQLEAELEKTSRRLQEVTARAETEAGKYKSAEEIIMSLTDKLEQVTDMLPPGQKGLLYNAGPIAKHTTVEHVFANATNMMCTM